MSLQVLICFALIGCGAAVVTTPTRQCPNSEWTMYSTPLGPTCLRVREMALTFNKAFEDCKGHNSHLLHLYHSTPKVKFVNDLVMEKLGGLSTSLWFFDPEDIYKEDLKPPKEWMVLSTDKDLGKVRVSKNMTNVQRRFICEVSARLAPQLPKFEYEPEDLQLVKGDEDVKLGAFTCQVSGMPSPRLHWVQMSSAGVQRLDISTIFDPEQALMKDTEELTFFDLRLKCNSEEEKCPEFSELIVLNPQLLKSRIACVGTNEFGQVISREALVVEAEFGEFRDTRDQYFVQEGETTRIPCNISTNPDAASVEWLRVENGENSEKFVPVEELNQRSQGGFQISKATFELLIDWARPEDSGEFVCVVEMHNGRLEHARRERRVQLSVEPCNCDRERKQLQVFPSFPSALSLNPKSNEIIRSGDDFLLECPCSGKRRLDEKLTVAWNVSSLSTAPMNLPILPTGSALLIRDAQVQHSGLYSCRCQRAGEKSEWSSVHLRVLPTVAPRFQEIVRAPAGANVAIKCDVPSRPSGIQVRVKPVRANLTWNHLPERFHLQSSASGFQLQIGKLQTKDAGAYGCHVEANFFGLWKEFDTFYTHLQVA